MKAGSGPRVAHDVALGATIGTVTGLLYGLVVMLFIAQAGEDVLVARHRLRLWELTGLYVIGGAVGGVIWGILRRLNRSVIGAMVNGYLTALPAFFLTSRIVVTRSQYGEGRFSTVILVALLSATAGALAGGLCRVYFSGDRALPLDDM